MFSIASRQGPVSARRYTSTEARKIRSDSALWMKGNDAIHNSDVLVIVVQRQVGRSEVNQVREISRIELTCALEIVYGVSPATLTAVHRSS